MRVHCVKHTGGKLQTNNRRKRNRTYRKYCFPSSLLARKKKKNKSVKTNFFLYSTQILYNVPETDRGAVWCTRARVCVYVARARVTRDRHRRRRRTDGHTRWDAIIVTLHYTCSCGGDGRASSYAVGWARARPVRKTWINWWCRVHGTRSKKTVSREILFFVPIENALPACVRFHSPSTYTFLSELSAARPSLTLDRSAVCHGRRLRTTLTVVVTLKFCHVRPRIRSHQHHAIVLLLLLRDSRNHIDNALDVHDWCRIHRGCIAFRGTLNSKLCRFCQKKKL